jgi:heavy metal sensor kinase
MASTRSTKARLTLYFTALFGAIVVCLALASYLLVTRAEYTDLDSGLHVAVVATAMSAEHELSEHAAQRDGEADLQTILDESLSNSLPDTQIMIREGERTFAYKGGKAGSADLRKIASSNLQSLKNVDGLRIAELPLHVAKFGVDYEIFAASSLQPVVEKLNFFRRVLLVFVPLGLALAACAGYLLSRRALAPLNELTRTIETITSSDLSARVRVAPADNDLGRLANRFNCLLDRLESAFNAQRHFMAEASHQLRTPLTVALSSVQVTARDGRRSVADCDGSLSLVESQLLRLRRIIDNMLFLSQADATSLGIEKREFYLDDAVAEAVQAANALARPKRQTVKIEQLPEARCLGDEELLKQAVLILLENAVKYTQDGGHIAVHLQPAGRYWSCRIGNNGRMIPEADRAHIFERFYRGKTADVEKTAGSGLGLAIARTIAQTHEGDLELVKSDDEGTVFELRIPACFEVAANESQAKSFAVRI